MLHTTLLVVWFWASHVDDIIELSSALMHLEQVKRMLDMRIGLFG